MHLPDAVIAGAPKCGTSTLFGWLDDHPEVQGSRPKETFFLMDRGHPLFDPDRNVHDHGLETYGTFFPEPPPAGARLRVEATTHYLYQRTAPRVLGGLTLVPQVIFVLRKPSERVYSSFRFTQHNLGLLSPESTFRDFLALAQGADASRISDPRWGGAEEIWRNDVANSRYAEHLARWAEHLPRDHLHVLLFEDLRSDPAAFMRRVAGILGVDPAFYDSYGFPRRNESYRVRSQRLQRLARRLGMLIPGGPLRSLLRGGYMRALTRSGSERPPEDVRALRELDHTFAPHDARLAREWGLDLSAWA